MIAIGRLATTNRSCENGKWRLDMNLSIGQRESLQRGDPIRLAEDGLEFVIVRADVFDLLKKSRLR